jgi:hypothetical protein
VQVHALGGPDEAVCVLEELEFELTLTLPSRTPPEVDCAEPSVAVAPPTENSLLRSFASWSLRRLGSAVTTVLVAPPSRFLAMPELKMA